jgi:SPX domain protein involved in polyphosphate accumulation
MSFRIEEKINIRKDNLFKFYEWLNLHSAETIHPNRRVSSIYFDNHNLNMYHHSIEGLIPRKKIRIRSYNDLSFIKNNLNIEKKITSAEGRFKETTIVKNLNEKITFGIFDQNYGVCKPVAKVSYDREYFKVLNYRITLDTNINYSLYYGQNESFKKNKDENIIVEIKSQNTDALNDIQKKFSFQRIRFSKYCRAIDVLFFDKANPFEFI